MINKHAYLITAHNNFYVLKKLLSLLDDERNDIYIHIDKKIKNFDFASFSNICKYSTVKFVPRINVYWGDYSHIENRYILLEQSIDNNYKYYHFLSGVDLPIKTQDYIHDFFKTNDGKEFVGFSDYMNPEWVDKIHILSRHRKRQKAIGYIVNQFITRPSIKAQYIIKYNRTNKFQHTFKKGSDWYSITHDFAKYIISNKETVKDLFKYAMIPSELYVQTLIWNSNFKQNLYDANSKKNVNDPNDPWSSSLRYIDWKRGYPYVFRISDFNDLINSDKIFARKFDENIDREIIDKIYMYIKKLKGHFYMPVRR